MINKQKLWFITLFSLILVLGVYYVTMPNELLNSSNIVDLDSNTNPVVSIEESDALTVLKVTSDEERLQEMNDLRIILTNVDSTIDDKNNAYEKLKLIEQNKSKEEDLMSKIKKDYNLKSFIKITNNQIKVTVAQNEHNYELANNIIRSIQEEYKDKMYITVKFEK